MSVEELRPILSTLKNTITDDRGLLRRAEEALSHEDVEGARVDMAKAVRRQITAVKRYDTTGRSASQAQQLEQIRTKLLKGTTWLSCKKAFKNWTEHFSEVNKGLDVMVVKLGGGLVGFGAWIMKAFVGHFDPNVMDNIQMGARWARRLYAPLKATGQMLFDKEGRKHLKTVCGSIFESGCQTATKVWEAAKRVSRTVVTETKKAVASGYTVAKRAATGFVSSVKAGCQAVVSAASRVGSSICSAVGGFFRRVFA